MVWWGKRGALNFENITIHFHYVLYIKHKTKEKIEEKEGGRPSETHPVKRSLFFTPRSFHVWEGRIKTCCLLAAIVDRPHLHLHLQLHLHLHRCAGPSTFSVQSPPTPSPSLNPLYLHCYPHLFLVFPFFRKFLIPLLIVEKA